MFQEIGNASGRNDIGRIYHLILSFNADETHQMNLTIGLSFLFIRNVLHFILISTLFSFT